VLGPSFLSRNIPLRFICSLVRMRAGKEKGMRAPHRNSGKLLRFARNFGYASRYAKVAARRNGLTTIQSLYTLCE
jgi:hypothetical protein